MLSFLAVEFGLKVLNDITRAKELVVVTCYVLAFIGVFVFDKNYNDRIEAVVGIGTKFSVGIILLVLITVSYNQLTLLQIIGKHNETGKHLVLVVLDGLPTQYLHTYNSDAEPTTMDKVLKESLVFKNFYTSFPKNYRYFGTLYNSSPVIKRPHHKGNKSFVMSKKGDNLLSMLQSNGVYITL